MDIEPINCMIKGTQGDFPLGILTLKHLSYVASTQNKTEFSTQDILQMLEREQNSLTH